MKSGKIKFNPAAIVLEDPERKLEANALSMFRIFDVATLSYNTDAVATLSRRADVTR